MAGPSTDRDDRDSEDGGNPFRTDTEQERRFRLEVRVWIAENLPPGLRDSVLRPGTEDFRLWHRRLYERGWIAPQWPGEAGGMGATVREQLVLVEEMVRAGAPQVVTAGVGFVGPLIIEFGTEAQKARHLPSILSGDVEWAQGYSEPGAGSDLASLRTGARLEGGRFIVNGHKIWQTRGYYADWIFTLVRTRPDAPRKHEGISCLLIDMRSPGVTVRPIVTITGETELSEVFFDDVAVPEENLVGPLNDGWRLANALLAHERLAGSNPQFCMAGLARARRIAIETGVIDDAAFRDRLAAMELETLALAALFEDAVRMREAGGLQGPDTSVLKIAATQTLQAVSDLMAEAAGGYAADEMRGYAADWMTGHAADGMSGHDADPKGDEAGVAATASAHFLQSRRATIFGGTLEIHKSIVARRLLGLQ